MKNFSLEVSLKKNIYFSIGHVSENEKGKKYRNLSSIDNAIQGASARLEMKSRDREVSFLTRDDFDNAAALSHGRTQRMPLSFNSWN